MYIRPAQASDQAAIKNIIRASHLNPMGLDWQRFIVAEQEGQVIGIGQVKPHGDGSRELASIATVFDHRHHGVASAIIQELVARENGTIYLFCRPPLESFYQRFGFRRIEQGEMTPYFRRMYGVAGMLWKLSRSPVQVIVMKR